METREDPIKLNTGVLFACLSHGPKFKVMLQVGTGAAQVVIFLQNLIHRVQNGAPSTFSIMEKGRREGNWDTSVYYTHFVPSSLSSASYHPKLPESDDFFLCHLLHPVYHVLLPHSC